MDQPRTPPPPSIMEPKDDMEETSALIASHSVVNSNKDSRWKLYSIVALAVIFALGFLLFGKTGATNLFINHVSGDTLNQDFEILPDESVRQTWTYVTATSPFALSKACAINSTDSIRTKDGQTNIQESAKTILSSLNQRYQQGKPTVLCGRPPLTFSDLKQASINVVIYIEENGLMAAFDEEFALWARARGMEKDIEDSIDESCLQRRIETKRKYSCTVLEIGVIRAAYLWSKLSSEARSLDFVTIRTISDSTDNIAAQKRLNSMGHQSLIKQLYHDQLAISEEQPGIVPVQNFPEKPQNPIDAGYCKVVYNGQDRDYTGAKAVCLPTFIVIGAQKAGTDELSVWLNQNKYSRRMDGGVEIHFFDCVGRGIGNDRFSCTRKRSWRMRENHYESREILRDPNTKGLKKGDFSWFLESKTSPFVDDLWQLYIRLGHLHTRNYYFESGPALVFEKTPSYLDMADARDVVRILPHGKFILLTRDPVSRLVSAYFQFCGNSDNHHEPCSMKEFSEFTRQLIKGKLDTVTPDKGLIRRLAFARAARHGDYAAMLKPWIKYFWTDESMSDKQFLVVDAHHFRYSPLAVMYTIESFTGNRLPFRRHKYNPRYKNGYYTLGDYTKALNPSHNDPMPPDIKAALEEYYKPAIARFREILANKNGPLLFGCGRGDRIPPEYTSQHPQLFDGPDRFRMPPWLSNEETL